MADNKKIAPEGASMMDLSIQHLGTLEDIYSFLEPPGFSVSQVVLPGQSVNIPTIGVGNENVKNFFKISGESASNDAGNFSPPVDAGDFNKDFKFDFR